MPSQKKKQSLLLSYFKPPTGSDSSAPGVVPTPKKNNCALTFGTQTSPDDVASFHAKLEDKDDMPRSMPEKGGNKTEVSSVIQGNSIHADESTPSTPKRKGMHHGEQAKGVHRGASVQPSTDSSLPETDPVGTGTAQPRPASGAAKETTGEELSEYEKERLVNIARNKEFLRSLGLDGAVKKMASDGRAEKAQKRRLQRKPGTKKKRKSAAAAPAVPVRRSTRNRSKPLPIYNADDASDDGSKRGASALNVFAGSVYNPPTPVVTEAMLPFDDSGIFAYDTGGAPADDPSGSPGTPSGSIEFIDPKTVPIGATITQLKDLHVGRSPYFCDPSLKKVYSISFKKNGPPDVFVAGGHGGRIAVFGTKDLAHPENDEGEDGGPPGPLLSFKGHSGWISTVQFIGENNFSNQASSNILMTASNDAVVTLWDLRKQLATDRARDVRPLKLTSKNDLHANGIFCAHEKKGKLVTASKDKSVCFSEISSTEGGLIRSIRELNFHTSVVKCAKLRDEHVLASCGNDLSVCVFDVRTPTGHSMHVDGAHDFAGNSLDWHPTDENMLISACFGNTIRVWDLRKFTDPVRLLKGHAQLYDGQRGGIYHPCFINRGKNVLTTGAKCDSLSLFDFATGELRSKGSLDIGEATTVAPSDELGTLIAAARGGKIVLLQPDFAEQGTD